MSEIVDRKYLAEISGGLELFKKVNNRTWNCRCPICGDSAKNKTKARGYFFIKSGRVIYYCHNCNASMSLSKFIKTNQPETYRRYILEVFGDNKPKPKPKPKADTAKTDISNLFSNRSIDATPISSLDENHKAVQYLNSRKIPSKFYTDIYYTDDFGKTVLAFNPDYAKRVFKEERIIIPMCNEQGWIVGMLGRALDPNSKLRYMMVKKNDDVIKIFGLERVDWKKTVYVCEGAFDAFFLPNAISVGDADLLSVLKYRPYQDYVFVNDNESRNPEILRQYRREIEAGHKLVIYPDSIVEKDLNDMVLADIDPVKVVEQHTFSGLQAKLEFEKWKKI